MCISKKMIGSAVQAGGASGATRPRTRRSWIGGTRGLAAGMAAGLALASMVAVSAGAQSAADSALYARAQQMVANGSAASGRKLADSVASAATPGSSAYAEGLFWRATLAANARDSEHEYRQIIVDYPLSGRVPAALLRIGQLEAARGETAAALQHFQRLVLEHPLSPLRADGSYWVAQMYFEGNDDAHACVANADALASVRAANVELKNRIDFQQQRCRGVVLATNDDAAPATAPARVATRETVAAPKAEKKSERKPEKKPSSREHAAPTRAETAPKVANAAPPGSVAAAGSSADSSAKASSSSSSGVVNRQPTKEEVARALASARLQVSPTAAASIEKKSNAPESSNSTATRRGKSAVPAVKASAKPSEKTAGEPFAVQVAAFGTRGGATVLANKLHGRGYDAYVDGSRAPYRVRIGHYSSHAGAAAALAKLKAKHIDGFVVER